MFARLILTKVRAFGGRADAFTAEHAGDFRLHCAHTDRSEAMSTVEEKPTLICERCDKESAHMTEVRDADDRVHHICWTCLYRTEKRINVNRRWQRSRRG
jgi:hypothetical protein